MTKTNLPFNLSQKAILAFFFPLITAVAGALGSWVAQGGTLDWDSIRIAVAGLIAAAVAALGAYIGQPGDVVQPVGPASDDLLSADAQAELNKPAG